MRCKFAWSSEEVDGDRSASVSRQVLSGAQLQAFAPAVVRDTRLLFCFLHLRPKLARLPAHPVFSFSVLFANTLTPVSDPELVSPRPPKLFLPKLLSLCPFPP